MKEEVKPTDPNSSTSLEPTVLPGTYLIPCTTKKALLPYTCNKPNSLSSQVTERVKVALTNTRECTGKHSPKPCPHTSLNCSQKYKLNVGFVSTMLKWFPKSDYALINNTTNRLINVAAGLYSIFTSQ